MKLGDTFLTTPENRSAWTAIQDLLHGLIAEVPDLPVSPLFLHGPPGSGKTLLVRTLTNELAGSNAQVCLVSASDFATATNGSSADPHADPHADLLILEDLQHLPVRSAETVVQLIDERLRRRLLTVFTAVHGPSDLRHRGASFPYRLTSRLAGGLVVALEPLQATSRRRLLTALTEQHKLTIAPPILDWLAEHLTGGGRQLEGAVRQLKTLQRLHKKPLRLDDIRTHFRTQIEATAPTVKRIAEHVSGYYQVKPTRLRSDKRTRDVLLPRQVSMYLARQLTDLSLEQIGRYFGGRDHKTVQHACTKVAQALKTDRSLSGVVRRMHAELA